MRTIFHSLVLICLSVINASAQYDNSAWGNTLNGNASGSGGFVTIYSSLRAVDGTGSFTALKVPGSNTYIEDVDVSTLIATVPLSKRLKAKAGQPFTIDLHTAGYAGTNFANPSVGIPYWTVKTGIVVFQNTNPKMPNGIGQNGGPSKYSNFFSWEQKFPLNYYAPGNVNYEGYKKEFVFTKGSTEGYIVFKLVENEYWNQGLGVLPTGVSHTTLLLIPFVVEGPLESTIQPLGIITKPQIPKMVLHRPPGDQSTAFISSGQKTCRSFKESFEYSNDISGFGSIKWGVKATLGILIAQDLEAFIRVTGTVGGGSVELQTSETEECVEIVSDITLTSLDDGSPGGDVFIGYGFDAEYGMATNLYIGNNNTIQYNKGLYLVQQNPVRDFILSESGIIQDSLSNWNNIINNPSTAANLKQIARNQNDAWKKVLAANNANILAAKSGIPLVVKTFEGGVSEALHSETLSIFQTQTIETSSFISGGVAVDFLAEYGGTGVAGGVQWKTSSTSGASTTSSGDITTTIGYTLKDGDAGDRFTAAIFRDPVYGTTVFDLIGNSKTSCPFEGGYQIDQPTIQIVGNAPGFKTISLNNVSIGQAANFKVNLCNNSTISRSYKLGVKTGSLSSNLDVRANGNTNITSLPTTITIPPTINSVVGCLTNFDIDIIRPIPGSPVSLSNLVIEWYAGCEPDIKDSLIVNVNWATPPPPVLGALPYPNPLRQIYTCGVVQPIPLNASCSGGTQPYWYKSATGGLTLGTNSIVDNNAVAEDVYYVSCESPNYISPRSFYGIVTFHSSPVIITESGPLSFCAPGSVTFNSYADNNNKVLTLVRANNQYVEVPHSNSLNLSTSFTFEAWVNYSGASVAIIDKGNYDFLWMLNANGNANKLGYFERGIGWKYSNDAVPENTWTHVALTLQGGILRFYINGVASGNAFLNSAFQDNLAMNIGRQQPSSCMCNHFNGSMDELRLWNVAKSQAEIQASMKIGVLPNSAGLVAYYKFNEASGNIIDATNNNNHGVLINGASRQTALTVPFNELNVLWAPLNITTSSITANTSGIYTASVNYGLGCTTSVNKTVSVNSNAALVSLSSPNDDFSIGNISRTASGVNGKIVAINKITGTAKVTYRAKSLELNNGFRADGGTVFSAEIGGCY